MKARGPILQLCPNVEQLALLSSFSLASFVARVLLLAPSLLPFPFCFLSQNVVYSPSFSFALFSSRSRPSSSRPLYPSLSRSTPSSSPFSSSIRSISVRSLLFYSALSPYHPLSLSLSLVRSLSLSLPTSSNGGTCAHGGGGECANSAHFLSDFLAEKRDF